MISRLSTAQLLIVQITAEHYERLVDRARREEADEEHKRKRQWASRDSQRYGAAELERQREGH
jgi:hypothetical protein